MTCFDVMQPYKIYGVTDVVVIKLAQVDRVTKIST